MSRTLDFFLNALDEEQKGNVIVMPLPSQAFSVQFHKEMDWELVEN